MAKVFRKVGHWFMELPEEAKVDIGKLLSNADLKNGKVCGSPCCVGGWLAVYFDTDKNSLGDRDYIHGANAFAEKLGFEKWNEQHDISPVYRLRMWATENPKMWGNEHGSVMFIHAYAYNEGEKEYTEDTITTKAIGEKFLAVADRLEKEELYVKRYLVVSHDVFKTTHDGDFKDDKYLTGFSIREDDKWEIVNSSSDKKYAQLFITFTEAQDAKREARRRDRSRPWEVEGHLIECGTETTLPHHKKEV